MSAAKASAPPWRSLQRVISAMPRWPLYFAGAIPGVWIYWRALNGGVVGDPVKTLEHVLGLWALRFLIASLCVAPVRCLGGPNFVRFRRALGLLAFFYAFAHLLTWAIFDRGLDLHEILADIVKRPYITIGMFAFAILTPLAITSNGAMIQRMGAAAWQRLHRWIYVAAIAAAIHFLMSVKSWPAEPLIYAAIVAVLLLIRAGFALRKGLRVPKHRTA